MQGLKRKIVYVVSFELIAVLLATTLLRWLSDSPVATAGVTALASSAIAMAWNYAYNTLFEAWEVRQARKGRSLLRRIVHAIGFEAGLVTMLVPLFAWVLGVGLLAALLLNAVMIVFFLVYAFLFNLVFDRVFGLPLSAQAR
ncbi:PACE efflux transporter [Ramlibacter tataouinensis]|uniref:PACE efflux transporter n=1 Tax=Ramlibacter tataouinensis TaxID=94132 RepID=UPI0022F3CC80|nr:PACE efflux transporter [Ramlibacter tataouinensis]WBY04047.1 PACE efflux transporter [Ramlibacter tataouinensis]